MNDETLWQFLAADYYGLKPTNLTETNVGDEVSIVLPNGEARLFRATHREGDTVTFVDARYSSYGEAYMHARHEPHFDLTEIARRCAEHVGSIVQSDDQEGELK
ncbi:hypothetical protein Ritam007_80 [Mycobacterium phage Ritam007]|nr:hypothetical protein Saroj_80 [Mycobacterium phage Saroj]UZV39606.1 hypothetical protein Ritam007_80 [Mycobacterium phage Ritam007]